MSSIVNGCSSYRYFDIRHQIDHWGEADTKEKARICATVFSYFTIIIPIFMFVKRYCICSCLKGDVEVLRLSDSGLVKRRAVDKVEAVRDSVDIFTLVENLSQPAPVVLSSSVDVLDLEIYEYQDLTRERAVNSNLESASASTPINLGRLAPFQKSFDSVREKFQQRNILNFYLPNSAYFQISSESQKIRFYDFGFSFSHFGKFKPYIESDKLVVKVHNTWIAIQQTNILDDLVQAVVNPTNEKLQADSGIGAALQKHYGSVYRERTEAIVEKIEKLSLGCACLMEVSDLRYNAPQFVVHVVVPNYWKCGQNLEENSHLLHSAIFNGLVCADEREGAVQTIGIPALGMEFFRFEKKKAVEVVVHTLVDYIEKNYIEKNRSTYLRQININLNEHSQELTQQHFDIYKNVLGLS